MQNPGAPERSPTKSAARARTAESLLPDQRQELLLIAEQHLDEARRPWEDWNDLRKRLQAVTTAFNIGALLAVESITYEADQVLIDIRQTMEDREG